MPFRERFFDGFEFLAFLRGLSRQHHIVGIFERLFFFQFLQAPKHEAWAVGIGDEPLHFRMFGLAEQVERSPLPGGLVDGELRLLDFRACRVKDMRPEVEQARFVFARYAVCPDDDGVPRLHGVKRVREDDPLLHVRVHDLRVVDDGAEHDQSAGAAGPVFLEGLIELAQGKPHPHANPRRFGAQYCCHTFSSMLSLD